VQLSGITLWTTDIGGYANGDPNDPGFRELVVRWVSRIQVQRLNQIYTNLLIDVSVAFCNWILTTTQFEYGVCAVG
jgi:hypothetical protein